MKVKSLTIGWGDDMACQKADELKQALKEPVITILEDLDFSYTQSEIELAIDLWNRGLHINDMAKLIRKHDTLRNAIDEIALLIIHLKRQELITNREGGLYGNF